MSVPKKARKEATMPLPPTQRKDPKDRYRKLREYYGVGDDVAERDLDAWYEEDKAKWAAETEAARRENAPIIRGSQTGQALAKKQDTYRVARESTADLDDGFWMGYDSAKEMVGGALVGAKEAAKRALNWDRDALRRKAAEDAARAREGTKRDPDVQLAGQMAALREARANMLAQGGDPDQVAAINEKLWTLARAREEGGFQQIEADQMKDIYNLSGWEGAKSQANNLANNLTLGQLLVPDEVEDNRKASRRFRETEKAYQEATGEIGALQAAQEATGAKEGTLYAGPSDGSILATELLQTVAMGGVLNRALGGPMTVAGRGMQTVATKGIRKTGQVLTKVPWEPVVKTGSAIARNAGDLARKGNVLSDIVLGGNIAYGTQAFGREQALGKDVDESLGSVAGDIGSPEGLLMGSMFGVAPYLGKAAYRKGVASFNRPPAIQLDASPKPVDKSGILERVGKAQDRMSEVVEGANLSRVDQGIEAPAGPYSRYNPAPDRRAERYRTPQTAAMYWERIKNREVGQVNPEEHQGHVDAIKEELARASADYEDMKASGASQEALAEQMEVLSTMSQMRSMLESKSPKPKEPKPKPKKMTAEQVDEARSEQGAETRPVPPEMSAFLPGERLARGGKIGVEPTPPPRDVIEAEERDFQRRAREAAFGPHPVEWARQRMDEEIFGGSLGEVPKGGPTWGKNIGKILGAGALLYGTNELAERNPLAGAILAGGGFMIPGRGRIMGRTRSQPRFASLVEHFMAMGRTADQAVREADDMMASWRQQESSLSDISEGPSARSDAPNRPWGQRLPDGSIVPARPEPLRPSESAPELLETRKKPPLQHRIFPKTAPDPARAEATRQRVAESQRPIDYGDTVEPQRKRLPIRAMQPVETDQRVPLEAPDAPLREPMPKRDARASQGEHLAEDKGWGERDVYSVSRKEERAPLQNEAGYDIPGTYAPIWRTKSGKPVRLEEQGGRERFVVRGEPLYPEGHQRSHLQTEIEPGVWVLEGFKTKEGVWVSPEKAHGLSKPQRVEVDNRDPLSPRLKGPDRATVANVEVETSPTPSGRGKKKSTYFDRVVPEGFSRHSPSMLPKNAMGAMAAPGLGPMEHVLYAFRRKLWQGLGRPEWRAIRDTRAPSDEKMAAWIEPGSAIAKLPPQEKAIAIHVQEQIRKLYDRFAERNIDMPKRPGKLDAKAGPETRRRHAEATKRYEKAFGIFVRRVKMSLEGSYTERSGGVPSGDGLLGDLAQAGRVEPEPINRWQEAQALEKAPKHTGQWEGLPQVGKLGRAVEAGTPTGEVRIEWPESLEPNEALGHGYVPKFDPENPAHLKQYAEKLASELDRAGVERQLEIKATLDEIEARGVKPETGELWTPPSTGAPLEEVAVKAEALMEKLDRTPVKGSDGKQTIGSSLRASIKQLGDLWQRVMDGENLETVAKSINDKTHAMMQWLVAKKHVRTENEAYDLARHLIETDLSNRPKAERAAIRAAQIGASLFGLSVLADPLYASDKEKAAGQTETAWQRFKQLWDRDEGKISSGTKFALMERLAMVGAPTVIAALTAKKGGGMRAAANAILGNQAQSKKLWSADGARIGASLAGWAAVEAMAGAEDDNIVLGVLPLLLGIQAFKGAPRNAQDAAVRGMQDLFNRIDPVTGKRTHPGMAKIASWMSKDFVVNPQVVKELEKARDKYAATAWLSQEYRDAFKQIINSVPEPQRAAVNQALIWRMQAERYRPASRKGLEQLLSPEMATFAMQLADAAARNFQELTMKQVRMGILSSDRLGVGGRLLPEFEDYARWDYPRHALLDMGEPGRKGADFRERGTHQREIDVDWQDLQRKGAPAKQVEQARKEANQQRLNINAIEDAPFVVARTLEEQSKRIVTTELFRALRDIPGVVHPKFLELENQLLELQKKRVAMAQPVEVSKALHDLFVLEKQLIDLQNKEILKNREIQDTRNTERRTTLNREASQLRASVEVQKEALKRRTEQAEAMVSGVKEYNEVLKEMDAVAASLQEMRDGHVMGQDDWISLGYQRQAEVVQGARNDPNDLEAFSWIPREDGDALRPREAPLGPLSGAVVSKHVSELIDGVRSNVPDAVGKAMRGWRATVTGLQPFTRMYNQMSNYILAASIISAKAMEKGDLVTAGRIWKDAGKLFRLGAPGVEDATLREMHGNAISGRVDFVGEGGHPLAEFQQMVGVNRADNSGLRRNIESALPRLAPETRKAILTDPNNRKVLEKYPVGDRIRDWAGRDIKDPAERSGASRLVNTMMENYGKDDDAARALVFSELRKIGYSDAEARELAVDMMGDWTSHSEALMSLRDTAVPFIMYTAKAVPGFLRVMENPVVAATYLAAMAASKGLVDLALVGDDEEAMAGTDDLASWQNRDPLNLSIPGLPWFGEHPLGRWVGRSMAPNRWSPLGTGQSLWQPTGWMDAMGIGQPSVNVSSPFLTVARAMSGQRPTGAPALDAGDAWFSAATALAPPILGRPAQALWQEEEEGKYLGNTLAKMLTGTEQVRPGAGKREAAAKQQQAKRVLRGDVRNQREKAERARAELKRRADANQRRFNP